MANRVAHEAVNGGGGDATPEDYQSNEIKVPATNDNEPVVSSQWSSTEAKEQKEPRLHAKTFLAVAAVCLIYFTQLLCIVGAGAVGSFFFFFKVAQLRRRDDRTNQKSPLQQGQTIAAHFNDTNNVVWFSAPITILTVVLGPPVSQAADYWGRKWFLVILTFSGVIGAIVVARASSLTMAIAGFTILGISFGAQPLLHAVASEVLPRKWRSHGQAAILSGSCGGSIVGLLVGGALNRNFDPNSDGFRYYFYMTMVLYLVSSVLCLIAYNPPETDKQIEYRGRTMDKLKMLDWIGYFLLAAGLVLFCIALSWSQNPFPWSDPHVSATFAVGLAFIAALIAYETWFKKDGMFHHGLFTGNRNFALTLFCVFAEGLAFFASNIYFPFQVSVFFESDALIVNTRFSIMLWCAAVGAILTGVVCAATRRVRWITVLAFVIFGAFYAAMATVGPESNTAVWGYPVLLGFGLGMTLTALITVGQLSTPPELIAIASGTIISVRSLGGTVGIAIYNALFRDQLQRMGDNIAAAVLPKGLSPEVLPQFIGALNAHNATLLASVPGVTPEIIGAGADALLKTFLTGFRNVWIAAACFVGVAAVVAAFIFDPQQEFNNRVDAPIDTKESLDASS